MILVDLYRRRKFFMTDVQMRHINALYELMKEAQPHEVISHKALPSKEQHIAFVMSRPHGAWYMIERKEEILGYVYLSQRDEIGIRLFRKHTGQGIGAWAVDELMRKHGKRRYLANINPANVNSQHMFERLGFKHVQNTFALE